MSNSALAYKGPTQIIKVVEKTGKRGPFLNFVDADDKWFACFQSAAFQNIREAQNSGAMVVIGYKPSSNSKFNDAAETVNFDSKQPAFVKQGGQQASIPMAGITKDKMMILSYVKDLIVAGKVELTAWVQVTEKVHDRLLSGFKVELTTPLEEYQKPIDESLTQPW